jgi:hypothetical protein
VGPARQRDKGETEYRFGFLRWAADSFLLWAELVPSGPFSIFDFLSSFLFLFSYFFIPFSNLIQIDSNQLCKVSKIQNNHTEQ